MRSTAGAVSRQFALVALSLVLSLPMAASVGAAPPAQELQLLATEYPPVVFSEEGRASGLASDVVNEIQRRLGTRVAIQVLPWTRAYRMAVKGPNVVLFPTMRTKARVSQFKWVGPLMTAQTGFYSLSGTGPAIASLAEARTVSRVLVPRGFFSQQILQNAGFDNLKEVSTPETMVRMLIRGRAPLMVSDNITLGTLLGKVGGARSDVKLQFTFLKTQAYIAFSRDVPDALIQEWQHSLDEMKRDGTFARLYQKWLPGETPPGFKPGAIWDSTSYR